MNQNTDHPNVLDPDSPAGESRYHNYRTNAIPVVVHIIWILFWIGAVYYFVQYLLPALRQEIITPP